ncbi:MAG: hypothetical protein ACYC2Y_01625 [Armatimonadota bacterium]
MKKRLGDVVIEMGMASRDMVVECLNTQSEGNKKVPLGSLLVEAGYVTLDQLEKALDKQSKYRLPS